MDVVAFTYGGAVYCPTCLPYGDDERVADTVFDHNEYDYPLHCDQCHRVISITLTAYGFLYIKESYLLNDWRNDETIREYMATWPEFNWYFVPSFVGWLDPFGNPKE